MKWARTYHTMERGAAIKWVPEVEAGERIKELEQQVEEKEKERAWLQNELVKAHSLSDKRRQQVEALQEEAKASDMAFGIVQRKYEELRGFAERVCGDGCHCMEENNERCFLAQPESEESKSERH